MEQQLLDGVRKLGAEHFRFPVTPGSVTALLLHPNICQVQMQAVDDFRQFGVSSSGARVRSKVQFQRLSLPCMQMIRNMNV